VSLKPALRRVRDALVVRETFTLSAGPVYGSCGDEGSHATRRGSPETQPICGHRSCHSCCPVCVVGSCVDCNPKLDFLDCLKTCAEHAKLNKDDFWLHKFRSTFATRCLWAGVDLRTVQQWLGHSDMESTMRYLKPSRSQKVREKVNEIFG